MRRYLDEVKGRIDSFQINFDQIPREENKCADRLAKAASIERMLVPNHVLSFVQTSPLIDSGTNVQKVDSRNNWTTQLISYLKNGTLPDGKDAVRKLKVQASRFVLIKDVLYKRGFSYPYLRSLVPEKVEYIIREVHEGICGNHSGARSLVQKLIRAGYYWPTMQRDAKAYVKTCDKCQGFSNTIRQPSKELTLMMATWLFSQWGLDIMGPFLTAVRQLKFLVIGIDYFTKLVEAEALATLTENNILSFVWKNIICRHGIPRVLVFDNRKQFNNNTFKDFCLELGIKNNYTSPAHS